MSHTSTTRREADPRPRQPSAARGPWATVHEQELEIGSRLPWDIYTRAGVLVATKGFLIGDHTVRLKLLGARVVRLGEAGDAKLASEAETDPDDIQFSGVRDPLKGIGRVEGAQLTCRLPGDVEDRKIIVDYVGRVGVSTIIVTANGLGHGRSWTHYEGTPVRVKLMAGRTVWLFESRVMAYTGRPMGLLHLGYPAEATSKTVRASSRVETSLPATACVAGSDPVPCVVRDLSAYGASIELGYQLGDPGLKVEVDFELKSQVGNYTLKLPSVIRTVGAGARRAVRYGVEFAPHGEGRKQLALIIRSYLYERVIEQLEHDEAEGAGEGG